MKYAFCFLLGLAVFACDSSDNLTASSWGGLNGKWVETGTRTDTLTFQSTDAVKLVTLGRGMEFRNGHWAPKSGSGPYEYKLEGGKISLYWLLSSLYVFKEYNFRQEADVIVIDNFFNSPSGPTLTFERVK
ncbi:MAG TPA: hypothetical protein VGD65_17380 [Chryseosolibacter sp.]